MHANFIFIYQCLWRRLCDTKIMVFRFPFDLGDALYTQTCLCLNVYLVYNVDRSLAAVAFRPPSQVKQSEP